MRNMIKFGIILMVLLSMVGFASATLTASPTNVEINVMNDEIKQITVTYTSDFPATNATFIIANSSSSLTPWVIYPRTDLVGSWDQITWAGGISGLHAAPNTVVYDATATLPGDPKVGYNVSTWTFYLTDGADDTDDNAQLGVLYKLFFIAEGVESSVVVYGSSTTLVTGVPEFPTIALPIAAILGLAFIFQRRREED